MITLQCCC